MCFVWYFSYESFFPSFFFPPESLYIVALVSVIYVFNLVAVGSVLLIEGILDLVINCPFQHMWMFSNMLRSVVKLIISLVWAVALPFFYISSFNVTASQQILDVLSFPGQLKGVPTLYLMAVALYCVPNILATALFLFPMLRRFIEDSDWLIIRFLMWWSQVHRFFPILHLHLNTFCLTESKCKPNAISLGKSRLLLIILRCYSCPNIWS